MRLRHSFSSCRCPAGVFRKMRHGFCGPAMQARTARKYLLRVLSHRTQTERTYQRVIFPRTSHVAPVLQISMCFVLRLLSEKLLLQRLPHGTTHIESNSTQNAVAKNIQCPHNLRTLQTPPKCAMASPVTRLLLVDLANGTMASALTGVLLLCVIAFPAT